MNARKNRNSGEDAKRAERKRVARKNRLLCVFLPLFAALIYLALCFVNFDSSLWFDESYTAYLISGDFGEIWDLTALDVHPPLFYFALKIWSMIFGSADVALRAFSLFFGALAIILLFHLVRYKTRKLSLSALSALLVAICPMFVRYGEEARMYTLVAFLVLATTFVFFVILEREKASTVFERKRILAKASTVSVKAPTRKAPMAPTKVPTRKAPARKAPKWQYAIFAVLVAVGMYAHYFAAIAYLTLVIYLIYRKRFNKRWLFTFLGAAVLYIPWLPSLFSQISSLSAGYWIEPVTLATIPNYLAEALVYKEYAAEVSGWLVLPIVGVLALTAYAFRGSREKSGLFARLLSRIKALFGEREEAGTERRPRFLIFAAVLPPVLLFIVSLPPLHSMFSPRYVLYAVVALWVLFAFAIYRLWGAAEARLLAILLAGCVIVISVFGVVNVRERPLESTMKELVATIHRSNSPAPILANSPWLYYDAYVYTSEDYPVHFVKNWTEYEYGSLAPLEHYHYNVDESFEAFLAENETFWFVYDAPGSNSDPTTAAVSDSAELPRAELGAYRAVNTISNEQYIAIEFAKE